MVGRCGGGLARISARRGAASRGKNAGAGAGGCGAGGIGEERGQARGAAQQRVRARRSAPRPDVAALRSTTRRRPRKIDQQKSTPRHKQTFQPTHELLWTHARAARPAMHDQKKSLRERVGWHARGRRDGRRRRGRQERPRPRRTPPPLYPPARARAHRNTPWSLRGRRRWNGAIAGVNEASLEASPLFRL